MVNMPDPSYFRAVMICSCCGQYTVEEIKVINYRYGMRTMLRVRGPGMIKDVANVREVEAILRRHGKLAKMVEKE